MMAVFEKCICVVCVCVCIAVLLGVQEQTVTERSFKARLERRLALLLEEGLGEGSKQPRWKRSTAVGNNSLQVLNTLIQSHTHYGCCL